MDFKLKFEKTRYWEGLAVKLRLKVRRIFGGESGAFVGRGALVLQLPVNTTLEARSSTQFGLCIRIIAFLSYPRASPHIFQNRQPGAGNDFVFTSLGFGQMVVVVPFTSSHDI